MDTHFLTTFVMVVDRGSMAAAARLLNITPAAVAKQIHALERELGTPLIARSGRTVSVTEAGTRILEPVLPSLATVRRDIGRIIAAHQSLSDNLMRARKSVAEIPASAAGGGR